jgi:hypothetical protein
MRLGKLATALGLLLFAFGTVYASGLETLVKTLEKKHLITPQEAKLVLSVKSEQTGVVLLAKILEKNGILTPKDVEKIAKAEQTQKVEKVSAPQTEVAAAQRVETSKKGAKTCAKPIYLSKLQVENLKRLADLRISGLAYLHYDYTVWDTDRKNDDENAFKVTRAYLTVRKYFNNNPDDYFRLTADIYLDTNGSRDFRLKYAYLNWKINPEMQTEIGLVHRPWLDWEEHHGWLHRDVTNTFIEEKTGAHLVTSADYGIALKGKVKNVGYLVGIYNGEGYHSTDDDKHFGKALAGRVNYTVGGWTFAFHALYNDNDNSENSGQADQIVLHPYLMYRNDLFLVAAQYIYDHEFNYRDANGVKHSFDNYGWAINGDLYLKALGGKPITLFGRYGYWNLDGAYTRLNSGDINAYDRSQYIVGVAYDFNRFIKVSLANEYVKYSSGVKRIADRDYLDTLMAVMKVKW